MGNQKNEMQLAVHPEQGNTGRLMLDDGSKVAVIGGGPAGSFVSYFLLEMAQRLGIDIGVDIFEPRDFSRLGPPGCNMCAGIASESLVQTLATEGINLPATVVQRGIDSYVLHTTAGSVRIETPLHEKRIAAVHRGGGPRGLKKAKWGSFDGFLQTLAVEKGTQVEKQRVTGVNWEDGWPQVKTRGGQSQAYDLVVVAVGVNSTAARIFKELDLGYDPPSTTSAFMREYYLGEETVGKYVGNSMHVFLLNIPRLEFGAIVPKGDYVSVCLLGKDIDVSMVESFLSAPEVRQCLPPDWRWDRAACQCSPSINIQGATQPYADRIVFVGDCGVTRLYKDGIASAYRTAKAAATTAIFHGVSAEDFKRHYWPACRAISTDNRFGKVVFAVTREIQRIPFARRAVLRMVTSEQQREDSRLRMSTVMWDTFTGSASYRDVFMRTMHPVFNLRFLWDLCVSALPFNWSRRWTYERPDGNG